MPCKNVLGGGADRTNEKFVRNKMFNVVRTKNLLKSIVRQFFDRKMFDYRFYVFFLSIIQYICSEPSTHVNVYGCGVKTFLSWSKLLSILRCATFFRISDYKHHPEDVIGGALLGIR